MVKSRIFIIVWKTWKSSRHYTPSRTVWRIYASIKKDISTFWFSTGYFINEIKNIFSRVPIRHRNTRENLPQNTRLRNTRLTGSCSHFNFSFSPNVFYFLNCTCKYHTTLSAIVCQELKIQDPEMIPEHSKHFVLNGHSCQPILRLLKSVCCC